MRAALGEVLGVGALKRALLTECDPGFCTLAGTQLSDSAATGNIVPDGG